MAGTNEVSQVARLNTAPYRSEMGRMQNDTRSGLQKINRALTESVGAFRDYTNQIKKNASSIIGSVEEAGKAFAKNLGRGALAGGALMGVDAMRTGMREAVRTGMSFEQSLARVASRADLSAKQVKNLKDQFFELGKTGAKLESIPDAFNAIYGATGNVKQSQSVMEPIAKAAAMGNGDAGEVANFVKDRLKGEGKDINRGNVEGLLQSLVLAQRGGEFNNLQEAMAGMGGIDAAAQRRAGLSDRDMAGILAGSTRAGTNRETGVSAAQALVHMSQQGFGGSAALAGILGVGSFMKGGKFDASSLNRASANLRKSGRSDSENVALFQSAGLSEQESTGLLAILKNVEKFQEGVKKVATDTKTFDQSFEETTDTLSTHLDQLKNTTVSGFSDIFSPLMGIASKAAGGHFGDAAKGLPGALGESLKGVAAHPLLSGGALLATAAGGAVLKHFGIGGGAGLAKGVATGQALKQMGVTPVYVTNFDEVGKASSGDSGAGDFMKKMSDMAMGTGGIAGKGGIASRMARVLGAGGEGLGMAGTALGGATAAGLGLAAGKAAEYVGTGGMEQDVMAVLKRLFSSPELQQSGSQFGLPNGGQDVKVKIEVDSKDPGYMARPKMSDNPRDPRGT